MNKLNAFSAVSVVTHPAMMKAKERSLLVNDGERVKLQGGRIQFFIKHITVSAALYIAIQESYDKLRPYLNPNR